MQNGVTKGAAVEVMQTLRSSPSLLDVWQLHWSYTAGIEHNAPVSNGFYLFATWGVPDDARSSAEAPELRGFID